MNARIAQFPKPYVAIMDGLVMGGGVGLSAHGSIAFVTEKTKLAMPEVGLGFFPDVGGTWLLSRSPGEIGTYFGLTGQTMNGPDAIYARFARCGRTVRQTRRAARDARWPAGRRWRHRGEGRNRWFREPARPQDPSPRSRRKIDRWFTHDRMADIVVTLSGTARSWRNRR